MSWDPTPPESLIEQLVSDSRAGSADAFTLLVRRFETPIRAYLTRYTGDHDLATDLTQDTFLAVLRSLGRYDACRPFTPWLYGIATNLARSALRARKARPTESFEHLFGEHEGRRGKLPALLHQPDPSSAVVHRDIVQRVLDALGEQASEALLLAKLVGLPMREVGRIQGISEAAARQRVHRAEKKFRILYTSSHEGRLAGLEVSTDPGTAETAPW
jgi:RNA polymerase sigma-70 factor (ECF subfamily)